jgi:hypothetical protein
VDNAQQARGNGGFFLATFAIAAVRFVNTFHCLAKFLSVRSEALGASDRKEKKTWSLFAGAAITSQNETRIESPQKIQAWFCSI